jgi:hypothetical protein
MDESYSYIYTERENVSLILGCSHKLNDYRTIKRLFVTLSWCFQSSGSAVRGPNEC